MLGVIHLGADIQKTAVADGLKGVVDQVEDNLLQFAAVGLNQRNALGNIHMDGNVAVFRLFLVKIDHIVDHAFQIDGLDLNVEMTGESEQLSGNGAAALNRLDDRVDMLDHFRIILVAILDEEQVLYISGGLIDQGQGVVDFVGHPGGQLTDGGQLGVAFGQHHGLGLFPVGMEDLVDHEGRGQDDHHRDNDGADGQEPVDLMAQVQPDLHHAGALLDHHEDEGCRRDLGVDVGIADDHRAFGRIAGHEGLGSFRIRWQGKGQPLVGPGVVFGRRLKHPRMIDQKDIGMLAGPVGIQRLDQAFSLEGGPQDEETPIRAQGFDRHDHVRNVTVTQIDFTHTGTALLALHEPGLGAVVLALKIERSGVGHLGAVIGNHR
ncbi:hypothetical protein DESC_880020 [Desulfosarcina cetonica]|nr:hypothetical protein DESC_880020 [Desulfosarcina cetonica]